MLEFYFSYRGVLKRLRSGALGAEMDRIAGELHSQGYKPASAKLYLSRLARFSHFAGKRCGSKPISATIVDRYLRTLGAGPARIAAVTALQHARRVAPDRFVVATPCVVDDPDAALLASFSEYLSKVRGLEPKSRDGSSWVRGAFCNGSAFDTPAKTSERDGAACHCRCRAPAIAVRGFQHAHGGDVSHPNVSALSALGRPSPSGPCARRTENASLAAGPFAAASILERGSPHPRRDRQGNADRRSRSSRPAAARHDGHSQWRAARPSAPGYRLEGRRDLHPAHEG